MSGDIRYSLDLLHTLGGDLTGLADALDGRSAATAWTPAELGHRTVVAALEHFADSWDDKRELLTRSLRSLGEMAESTADTFHEVDEQAARAIREAVVGP
ncbi:MAG TPA: hypothetical protein VFR07_12595 [Mycobacteriales bacterium]|nr:hypothetical protein [Mycobacteriales bacterium]